MNFGNQMHEDRLGKGMINGGSIFLPKLLSLDMTLPKCVNVVKLPVLSKPQFPLSCSEDDKNPYLVG